MPILEKVKEIDRLGRIVIPAEWRRYWGKRVILVRIGEDEVIVRPLRKKGKLTDLIDSIEVEGVKDFTDTHNVREALHA